MRQFSYYSVSEQLKALFSPARKCLKCKKKSRKIEKTKKMKKIEKSC